MALLHEEDNHNHKDEKKEGQILFGTSKGTSHW